MEQHKVNHLSYFIELYWAHLKKGHPAATAYNCVEIIHTLIYGRRKYKNFKSFQNMYYRYIKTK